MAKETTFEHPTRGHVALLAYDSANNRYQAVYVDASGNLQVDVVDSGGANLADLETQLADILTELGQKVETADLQLDAKALRVNQQQYDGSAWRKSNLVWGYHDIWDENLGGTATTSYYAKATSAIPAGEIWVLQAISIRNNTRNPTYVHVYIARASGATVYLDWQAAPGLAVPVLATGAWALRTGDVATVYVDGCVSGDTIQGGVVGYKMDINM